MQHQRGQQRHGKQGRGQLHAKGDLFQQHRGGGAAKVLAGQPPGQGGDQPIVKQVCVHLAGKLKKHQQKVPGAERPVQGQKGQPLFLQQHAQQPKRPQQRHPLGVPADAKQHQAVHCKANIHRQRPAQPPGVRVPKPAEHQHQRIDQRKHREVPHAAGQGLGKQALRHLHRKTQRLAGAAPKQQGGGDQQPQAAKAVQQKLFGPLFGQQQKRQKHQQRKKLKTRRRAHPARKRPQPPLLVAEQGSQGGRQAEHVVLAHHQHAEKADRPEQKPQRRPAAFRL